jgi:hypothetical protein
LASKKNLDQLEFDASIINDVNLSANVDGLATEGHVFYTYLGFRPSDWDWKSRVISSKNGRIISVVQVENKKAKKVESYFFDHTDLFNASNGQSAWKISLAATRALNCRFSGSVDYRRT